jgi:hypothetical protein
MSFILMACLLQFAHITAVAELFMASLLWCMMATLCRATSIYGQHTDGVKSPHDLVVRKPVTPTIIHYTEHTLVI